MRINKPCVLQWWSSLAVTYCSILNGKLFLVWSVVIIFFNPSTTKRTTFAPKAKCKNVQSCLNMLKHDSSCKSCLEFSENNVRASYLQRKLPEK